MLIKRQILMPTGLMLIKSPGRTKITVKTSVNLKRKDLVSRNQYLRQVRKKPEGKSQISLALVIVSLININNWPYIGINNFQLMNKIRTLA